MNSQRTLEYQHSSIFLEGMSNHILHVPIYSTDQITTFRGRLFDFQQKENLDHQLFLIWFGGKTLRKGAHTTFPLLSSPSFH